MSHANLEQLERRVTERYAAAVLNRVPANTFDFDLTEWFGAISAEAANVSTAALPPTMQFPRQQWVTFPNRRAVALTLVDRVLDQADTLTDEQWADLTLLMAYGGRACL